MCPSGMTCLPDDCRFNKLAEIIQLRMMVQYKADPIPSNVTCSRHYIAGQKCPFGVKHQSLTIFVYNFSTQVPNSAIKECRNYTDFTGKEFMDPQVDKTVKAENPK